MTSVERCQLGRRGGCRRDLDEEYRAAGGPRSDAAPPTMQRHELAHDGEPNAAPRERCTVAVAESHERFPDVLATLLGNSRTLVLDEDARPRSGQVDGYSHRLARRPMAHGVVEQVEQHASQRVGIAAGRDRPIQPQTDRDATRLGHWPERADRLRDELA